MNTINIDSITISDYQRDTMPWTVKEIVESIKDHGYTLAYPVVIDDDNVLVDGGHRLEAARICGLTEVPFIRKPDDVSSIRYALQCNADRAKGREDDVFDKAELCWKLAQDGWKGEEIAREFGQNWSPTKVTFHSNIRQLLHPLSWNLARFTKNGNIVNGNNEYIVNDQFTIVNWSESHFRALLSHLSPNGESDHAIMRAQVATIREAIAKFDSGKVTAKWIGEIAERHAWHITLARYMRDNLVKEVPLKERKSLLRNIKANVFGDTQSDKNLDKFQVAVAAINQRILGVKLYCDDAFQRVQLLPDKSISLIVTDPPYNVTDNEWDRIGTDDEYIEWLGKWLDLIQPKLKDDYHLFLFCSPEYQARIELLIVGKNFPLKSRLTWWHKNMSMGRDVADKFICNDERIFHCGTHSLNWPPDWSENRFSVQEFAVPQSNFKEGKHHPTAKPVELLEHLIRIGSKPGDVILDTFAGGGSTGEASKNVGQRQCILVERDDLYCSIIENRLGIKRIKEV